MSRSGSGSMNGVGAKITMIEQRLQAIQERLEKISIDIEKNAGRIEALEKDTVRKASVERVEDLEFRLRRVEDRIPVTGKVARDWISVGISFASLALVWFGLMLGMLYFVLSRK